MTHYKGLTLTEIVECFADSEGEVDAKLLYILLYTYRSYCQPRDIILLIDKRLNFLDNEESVFGNHVKGNIGFVRAIIILFNSWLTFPFAFDFHELPHFQSLNFILKKIQEWPMLIAFIKSTDELVKSFKKMELLIENVLVNFNSIESVEHKDYHEIAVDCHFRDSLAFNNSIKGSDLNKNFFDFTPETIAVSLSYLDQKLLKKLRLPELVMHAQKLSASSVTDIINNYNQLHNVVKLTVEQPIFAKRLFDNYQYSGRNSSDSPENSSLKESHFVRSSPGIKEDQKYQVIKRWIFVSEILYQLRNFSSLVAILTALNSPELKNSMHLLTIKKSSKISNLYQSLLKVIEPYINQNKEVLNGDISINNLTFFQKPKSKLKNLPYHPCEIPYLGIYLRNMTYINEGFPNYIPNTVKVYNGNDDRIINIDKCRRQFDVMAQVRLIISSLNSYDVKENENFSHWYFHIQLEVIKAKKYILDSNLTSSTLSLDSFKSLTSLESSNSTENYTLSTSKNNFRSYIHKSHECLNATNNRRRLEISPAKIGEPVFIRNRSVGANITVHRNDPKVATVKLKEIRIIRNIINTAYKSRYFPTSSFTAYTTCDNICNESVILRQRQLLPSIVRSSSSVDHREDRTTINLEAILYKKIQIYENDRTIDFMKRVLNKFGKPNLQPDGFDVVQIVENDKEIVIPYKANLYYALAEKKEYIIEVRPREET